MAGPFIRLGLLLMVLMSSVVGAQADTIPDRHLGVMSCAGSPCHGAASTTKRNGVLQNEYLTWQCCDKHAKAFSGLEGNFGTRIAANLGITGAPKDWVPDDHGANEGWNKCFVCHTDNAPKAARGVQFKFTDGVGCEACHGASEPWLGKHASGLVSHVDLVSQYRLYPTERPLRRAELCLGCHLGDEAHPITHEIMGAGHPRLAFELQTFTQIEPPHFLIDDIYRKRKTVAEGVQFWAVGQAMALRRLVSGIADGKRRGNGVFPELIFFDCQACHHAVSNLPGDLRWQKRASTSLGPGVPHFNDANAIMLRAIALRVAPDLAKSLDANVKALHQALSSGAGNPAEVAQSVAKTADDLSVKLVAYQFTKSDMREMILALAQAIRAGNASDYADAEQATMAFASILDTLNSEGALDAGQLSALKQGLSQCYDATRKEDSYDPATFTAAAQSVVKALPAW